MIELRRPPNTWPLPINPSHCGHFVKSKRNSHNVPLFWCRAGLTYAWAFLIWRIKAWRGLWRVYWAFLKVWIFFKWSVLRQSWILLRNVSPVIFKIRDNRYFVPHYATCLNFCVWDERESSCPPRVPVKFHFVKPLWFWFDRKWNQFYKIHCTIRVRAQSTNRHIR